MNLRQLSVRLNKLGNNVQGNAEKLVRLVALSVDSTVVSATPVDTGRARSNWIVDINKAASGTIAAHVPGSEGSTAAENTRASLELARMAIATYKTGNTIHLTNNLPYIGRLNEGHSAQAPAGFVETAVLDGVAQVRGARLLDDNGVR